MAIEAFKALSAQEAEKLLQAPAVVVLLVAGADEKVDSKEEGRAQKLVRYRSITAESELQPYYEVVEERFEQDLEQLMQGWKPGQVKPLQTKLEELRPIVAKLDERYAKLLKQSWRTLAEQVAKASGGIIGFGRVSDEERKVIDLSMIN